MERKYKLSEEPKEKMGTLTETLGRKFKKKHGPVIDNCEHNYGGNDGTLLCRHPDRTKRWLDWVVCLPKNCPIQDKDGGIKNDIPAEHES